MKKKCNICNTKFIDFLSLGKHPCADTFLKTKKQAKNLKKYSLAIEGASFVFLIQRYKLAIS